MEENKDYLLIVIDSTDENGRYHLEAYSDEHCPDDTWIKESAEPCWCYLDEWFEHDDEWRLWDYAAEFKTYRYDLNCESYMDYYLDTEVETKVVYVDSIHNLKKIKELEDGLYLVVITNEGE